MSSYNRPRYKVTNWSSYNQALKSRGSLTIWFDEDIKWFSEPSGTRGRQPTFSDEAIRVCLMFKGLFSLGLRQTTGFIQSLLSILKLRWPVPDFSTLSRRAGGLKVNRPSHISNGNLHLLVDSTGIKISGDGEWHRKKHGTSTKRRWRKIHLAIDADTMEIRAVKVTDSNAGDSPQLPDLLDQIPDEESIDQVSGDGAYDTRRCRRAIAYRNANSCIPVRKNGRLWKGDRPENKARNEDLKAIRYLGKRIWKKWSGYHIRSRVETKMKCLKQMGDRLMSRRFDRQVTEVHIRVAILNRFTHLGTPRTVKVI